MSEDDLDRLVRRAFVSYGRYWADAATLDPDEPGLLEKSFVVEGVEHLLAAHEAGRGAVVALPHLGCWEVGAVWADRQGFPLTTVAEPIQPPELFEWLVKEREKLGLRVLPLGAHAANELLATLRRGGFIALLADRDIVGDGVDVELFGERTRMPGGPAALALRSGAPLIACAIYMRPRGSHLLAVRPPIEAVRTGRLREDVARMTQELARELEVLVRAAPEQWHVFQPNWPADIAPARA
ncbi:MAG: putative acyltransferase [Acidimicrobiaceae bacterium]|nr:putative acyltransferase [Acidimicrobiaceae bacterium]